MKRTIFTILVTLFIFGSAFSQDNIIKRDGEEIKSKILEVGTDVIKYKKFDNQDGPTYSIAKSEVFMIKYENGTKDIFTEEQKINNISQTKEPEKINLDEYGGESSFGIAILGKSLFGVPGRVYLSPKFAMEASISLGTLITLGNDIKITPGFLLGGGPVIYFSKLYKPDKDIIVLNGISIKGGYLFLEKSASFVSLNWVREKFKSKNKKHSFIFELGAGVQYINPWSEFVHYSWGTEEYKYGGTSGLIYIRCYWNWYSK